MKCLDNDAGHRALQLLLALQLWPSQLEAAHGQSATPGVEAETDMVAAEVSAAAPVGASNAPRSLELGGQVRLAPTASNEAAPLTGGIALSFRRPLSRFWPFHLDLTLDLEAELWPSGSAERGKVTTVFGAGSGLATVFDAGERLSLYAGPRVAWLPVLDHADDGGRETSYYNGMRLAACGGVVWWAGKVFGHALGLELRFDERFDRFASEWRVTPSFGLGLTGVLLPEPNATEVAANGRP